MVSLTDKSHSGRKIESVANFDAHPYVYPLNNVVTSTNNLMLLGTENYRVFCSSVIRAIKSHRKLGFTDETMSKLNNNPIKTAK